MKEFNYVIKDELGIHARPAGEIVKLAKLQNSNIVIQKNHKKVDAKKLLALMGLGVRCKEEVAVIVDGGDEETAYEIMKQYFEQNL